MGDGCVGSSQTNLIESQTDKQGQAEKQAGEKKTMADSLPARILFNLLRGRMCKV
jgi:hypothetical protein